MNKQRGITLVSLVVTIIILIILAGISINAALGENGIITIARKAKENTQLSQEEEQTELNELYMQIEAEGGASGGISYDEMTNLLEFKKVIAEAITNKGIETKATDSVETMANNIAKLETGANTDGTATESDIIEGKTAWIKGIQLTGKMKDNGAQTVSLNAGDTYTIPEGYHNGEGQITVGNLEEQTEATATAEQITIGYTAYVNGVKITGTRPAIAKVQSGSKSQNIANGGTVTWDIKFDTMFDVTPKVTWNANFTLNGGVTTVDRSHFVFTGTLQSGSWSTSEYVTFNWTATVE